MSIPATSIPRVSSVLICHDGDPLNRYGLARWMASFTDLAGIIEIREPKDRMRKRVKNEIKRIGRLRFLDVLAFRLYNKLALSGGDARYTAKTMAELEQRYPDIPASTRVLVTPSPNSPEAQAFLESIRPGIIVARCKFILNQRIFGLASVGTFVMHPGVCPEYRNAHGCFWALANRDLDRVGMTLLKIDAGVDTGPVYGYYGCDYDEVNESHNIIQARVVFDNLDALQQKFGEIITGTAQTIDTRGRESHVWGQPWMTAYLRWKRAARKARQVR